MTHLYQDLFAIATIVIIINAMTPVFRCLAKSYKEGTLFEANHYFIDGYNLGTSGTEMKDFPDSLNGWDMYQGNQFFFGKIQLHELSKEKQVIAKRLMNEQEKTKNP